MMYLVLVKKDMMHYVQNVMAVREMGQDLQDHHILQKVRLVSGQIKREVVDGTRRIRSEKLREHQYRGYARSLESKGVEWDGENNVENMWEQVKWEMVESVAQ